MPCGFYLHLFYHQLRSACKYQVLDQALTGNTEKDEKELLALRCSASRRETEKKITTIFSQYKNESYEREKRRALWVQKRAPDTAEAEGTPGLILR